MTGYVVLVVHAVGLTCLQMIGTALTIAMKTLFLLRKLKPLNDTVLETQKHAESHAEDALAEGFQQWPNKEEFVAAMKSIKYDPGKLHFGVCGLSGSGKSSLINALRGLRNNDLLAAKAGVVETTSEIGRYPDPRQEFPFSLFVWYDVPGAGTHKVPWREYFNKQGLWAFDFIIVVYDTRFTEVDSDVIENCSRFKIPVFIVRSKADQHISNMARDEDNCVRGDDRWEKVYQEKKEKYIRETHSDFSKQIESMNEESKKMEGESQAGLAYREWLSKQKVYIVSSWNFCGFVSAVNDCLREDPNTRKLVKYDEYVDEVHLFDGLLNTAVLRRSSETDSTQYKTLLQKFPMSTSGVIRY